MLDATASNEQSAASAPPRDARWQAMLALRFAHLDAHTRLIHREHHGPLVVQKTLYPEGPAVCQAVIVHPPGGIAGGDAIDLVVELGANAHAQLITPGAAKWYRSAGQEARQSLVATVAPGAVLEWLPHEAILFDGAQARIRTRLQLTGSAIALAWDIVCLGRTAHGEQFARGDLHQRIEVVRDGALVWVEQNVIAAGSGVRAALPGLAGHAVFGTLLVAAPVIEDAWLAVARAVGSDLAADVAPHDCAVTRVPGALLARCRSHSTGDARAWLTALWVALRPMVIDRPALLPRLWST
ncbi:MAG: urease accessory protein UreD [Betaproteobacteria bacterium]